MLALAESKEEVIEQLKKDVYSTSGVWDWDKVQVHPVSSPISSFVAMLDVRSRGRSVEGLRKRRRRGRKES